MTDNWLEQRLANRRKPSDPDYDAFYDGTDDELARMVPPYDWHRAQCIRDGLDTAQPGDVFAYQQPSGNRVLLVVARFEPTGIAGTTGVAG